MAIPNDTRCAICSKAIKRHPYRQHTHKYCSIACKGKAQIKTLDNTQIREWYLEKMRSITWIAEQYRVSTSTIYYWMQKNNIPIRTKKQAAKRAPLAKQIRDSTPYRHWRLEVLARDDSRCQECGSIENIHCHHKMSLNEILRSLRASYRSLKDQDLYSLAMRCDTIFDISNGVTLCEACHQDHHNFAFSKYGIK